MGLAGPLPSPFQFSLGKLGNMSLIYVFDIGMTHTYTRRMRKHAGRHGRGARWRRKVGDEWQVEARVSRFVEPALLLTLADGPTHGYDLADQIGAVTSTERIDYGNLYRLLRRLEDEEIVSSEWNDELPGRSKRTYSLTPSGAQLLEAWAAALEVTRERISDFLNTYTERSK